MRIGFRKRKFSEYIMSGVNIGPTVTGPAVQAPVPLPTLLVSQASPSLKAEEGTSGHITLGQLCPHQVLGVTNQIRLVLRDVT